MKKSIAIGCDHAGYLYKEQLLSFLLDKGKYVLIDVGCFSEASVDYPDFAHSVAQKVAEGIADIGILLCGSANGVAMTANKYPAIRAAICWNSEIATLARAHNDANICCLPARFISIESACEIVDEFLNTEFEGGRHKNRIDKIACS